jgi:hypothetical protein
VGLNVILSWIWGWTRLAAMPDDPFTLEFYRSPNGRVPARDWMRHLTTYKRRALAAALRLVLASHGLGVCATPYGRQLGHGLFEFRLDEDEASLRRKWGSEPGRSGVPPGSGGRILLRVFCHATGARVILVLGGYDKGRDPSPRRQQREITQARARLREFRSRRLP